jgi:hypothetical protein
MGLAIKVFRDYNYNDLALCILAIVGIRGYWKQ